LEQSLANANFIIISLNSAPSTHKSLPDDRAVFKEVHDCQKFASNIFLENSLDHDAAQHYFTDTNGAFVAFHIDFALVEGR
jgi:hypothetical protein